MTRKARGSTIYTRLTHVSYMCIELAFIFAGHENIYYRRTVVCVGAWVGGCVCEVCTCDTIWNKSFDFISFHVVASIYFFFTYFRDGNISASFRV